MLFKAKRRFEGDLGCKWSFDDTLEKQFNDVSEECDFYAIRHWFLKCATSPCQTVFYEKEGLKQYLEKVPAGDALEIWAITGDQMKYIIAKMPDENGLIPIEGGAY